MCSIVKINSTHSYPKFMPEMQKTHKLLVPQMCPIHFGIVGEVLRRDGMDVEFLQNSGPSVVEAGLKYVHNDICYPALLVIGQFIDALGSGKYDVDKTALVITQTGGGCRASNYIYLLRKALVKAGYPQVPVASINFSGLEKEGCFPMSPPVIFKAITAAMVGDEIMCLSNQTRPYEVIPGDTGRLIQRWMKEAVDRMPASGLISRKKLREMFEAIADDFAAIPVVRSPKVKVGVVGEIYVKFSALGNNGLEKFLHEEGCEINVPGLMGFAQYCIVNSMETIKLYGGSSVKVTLCQKVMHFITSIEKMMQGAILRHREFHAPTLFTDVVDMADGIVNLGAKMGEGWLLTAEMVELVKTGYPNIVCAQPFGCLPNHVVGKGMIAKIRQKYPQANITSVDYDPGATRVNQENRIRLMLAVGNEQVAQKTAPLAPAASKQGRGRPRFGRTAAAAMGGGHSE